jgi:Cupin superfamily protein
MLAELQPLLDFYLQQRQNPPVAFSHAQGTLPTPVQFFSLARMQALLNHPTLTHDWISVFKRGEPISLEPDALWKTVLGKRLIFLDKSHLNAEIASGAAVLLEGLDILDPEINAFVAALDAQMPCALANAVAFFSQSGNEAYKGHRDTDDVLVIQIAGKKVWEIFEPQQRRYLDNNSLSRTEMGSLAAKIVMNPGDALYVRAGVPHMCQTPERYSLHLSFDLIDRTPNIEQITAAANQRYNASAAAPYAPAANVAERYIHLLNSADFQNSLVGATAATHQSATRFRARIGQAAGVTALNAIK